MRLFAALLHAFAFHYLPLLLKRSFLSCSYSSSVIAPSRLRAASFVSSSAMLDLIGAWGVVTVPSPCLSSTISRIFLKISYLLARNVTVFSSDPASNAPPRLSIPPGTVNWMYPQVNPGSLN